MPWRCWLLLAVLGVGLAGLTRADERTVRFGYPPAGYPPFVLEQARGTPGGLMVDILRDAMARWGYGIKGVEAPKKRVETMLLDGRIDVVPRAREWTPDPERFAFTDPVLRVRDVIVTRSDRRFVYRGPADLQGKSLGTHIGYSYPPLDADLAAGHIKRADAHGEEAMLRMLLAGRTDATVINEFALAWLVKRHAWEGQFHIVAGELDAYDLRLMFSPRRADLVPMANAELARMRRDGRLRALLEQYGVKPE